MTGYNLALALHGLRRFPRSTALAALTVAIGLAATITTLTLLHALSADPLPGRSQRLYLAWVDTLAAKPIPEAKVEGVTMDVRYDHIKQLDAEAMLHAHRASHQVVLANMSADVSTDSGTRTQKNQQMLAASSEFIPMFGVTLLRGRNWTAGEDESRAPVAVVDVALARQLFGTADAVGKAVRVKNKLLQIIGVADTYAPQPHFYGLDQWTFDDKRHESVWLPYTTAVETGLEPSTDGCDDGAAEGPNAKFDAQRCAWLSYWVQLDTPQQVREYQSYLDNYTDQQRAALSAFKKPAPAALFSVSAWLQKWSVVPDSVRLNVWMALSFFLLCMVNVAGLLAARFLRRSSEIGIRRALGASRQSIFAQHLFESGGVCLAGGVLALPLTLLGLRILGDEDEGHAAMAKLDPTMFVALLVAAVVAGVVTGLLPAWRAARIEPGLQIKSE